MKELIQSFAFNEHAIRIEGSPEEPLFVAKDVCNALGISKYRDALARLDEDEGCPVTVDTPGGEQEMSAVTESGLYSLIFRSNKPEAKLFKRWVTHEVLPSIRKKGYYAAEQKMNQLEEEARIWKKNVKLQSQARIEQMRDKIFKGDIGDFYEAQWIWRLRQHFDSFKAIGQRIGWTPSKVSTRYKKYQRYLEATDIDRMRNARHAPDGAHLANIYGWTKPHYGDYSSFLQALIRNDQHLHHLSGYAIRESQKNHGGADDE